MRVRIFVREQWYRRTGSAGTADDFSLEADIGGPLDAQINAWLAADPELRMLTASTPGLYVTWYGSPAEPYQTRIVTTTTSVTFVSTTAGDGYERDQRPTPHAAATDRSDPFRDG